MKIKIIKNENRYLKDKNHQNLALQAFADSLYHSKPFCDLISTLDINNIIEFLNFEEYFNSEKTYEELNHSLTTKFEEFPSPFQIIYFLTTKCKQFQDSTSLSLLGVPSFLLPSFLELSKTKNETGKIIGEEARNIFSVIVYSKQFDKYYHDLLNDESLIEKSKIKEIHSLQLKIYETNLIQVDEKERKLKDFSEKEDVGLLKDKIENLLSQIQFKKSFADYLNQAINMSFSSFDLILDASITLSRVSLESTQNLSKILETISIVRHPLLNFQKPKEQDNEEDEDLKDESQEIEEILKYDENEIALLKKEHQRSLDEINHLQNQLFETIRNYQFVSELDSIRDEVEDLSPTIENKMNTLINDTEASLTTLSETFENQLKEKTKEILKNFSQSMAGNQNEPSKVREEVQNEMSTKVQAMKENYDIAIKELTSNFHQEAQKLTQQFQTEFEELISDLQRVINRFGIEKPIQIEFLYEPKVIPDLELDEDFLLNETIKQKSKATTTGKKISAFFQKFQVLEKEIVYEADYEKLEEESLKLIESNNEGLKKTVCDHIHNIFKERAAQCQADVQLLNTTMQDSLEKEEEKQMTRIQFQSIQSEIERIQEEIRRLDNFFP